MGKFTTQTLPHDLPENWNDNQYVSPGGTEAGLTEKHGYNYLMKQVNNAQKAINEMDTSVDKSFHCEKETTISPETSSYTSLHDFLQKMYNDGIYTVSAKVQHFVDLPLTDWGFHVFAYIIEGTLWSVQLVKATSNQIYFRQLYSVGGWAQNQWEEVMHTGSYQRLTGLAPASLE